MGLAETIRRRWVRVGVLAATLLVVFTVVADQIDTRYGRGVAPARVGPLGMPIHDDPPAPTKQSQDNAATSDNPTQLQATVCLKMIESGRFDEARAMAQQLVRQHPKSSRAHLLLALTYHKQRRYDLAEPLFARAVELDPNDEMIRPFYGWSLYYVGKADASRKMFDSFVRLHPHHSDAHFALGLLDFEADEIESAERRFRTAIESAAAARERMDEAKARARLSDVLVRQDKLDEAKSELERAIELNRDLYGAYFKLSRVLQRLGDADGAERMRRLHDEVRRRVRPQTGQAE